MPATLMICKFSKKNVILQLKRGFLQPLSNTVKQVYYRYNPETDNYERVYPTLKGKLASLGKMLLLGLAVAVAVLTIVYLCYDTPTEQTLRSENRQLKTQYNILSRRLENSLKVMDNIRNRDDNFYRVMMQMDPLSRGQRFAGLDNEERYRELQSLPDAKLITDFTRRLDYFDRCLYAQSLSFDELRKMAAMQQDKLNHIPSVLPISLDDYTMASGYGYRRDPVYGATAFHAGLDFAAQTGTAVYATADGRVSIADWKGGYGNCVDIDHGYNYLTRYAHLSKIDVREGQNVRRGEKIGEVGSTGKSTGPHLHYEVRFKDEPQNPINYYFMDITPEVYDQMIRMAENAGHVMD